MKLPPLSVIASWPTPNYINPVTRGNAALVVNIVMISLSFIVTCLRLYTRLRITRSAGLDDVFIAIAMGFAIAMCAITSLAVQQYGFNRHAWDVPLTWLPTMQKLNLSFQIVFSIASTFTKLSLLWFCKRLLGSSSKASFKMYNWCYIGGMIFVAVCCIVFTSISIFQCTPVHAYWDLEPSYPYKCFDTGVLLFAASIINIFTDFLVTVLPMPLIWNLKLATRQRIAVISIFGLGIFVNVAGSCRTVYVYKALIASYDETWQGWPILLSAAVEIDTGLICASAPALRPLVAAFLPRLLSNTSQNTGSYMRRTVSQKIRLPSGQSKSSHYRVNSGQSDDGFEVLRTVEMDTWTEARKPGQRAVGRTYEVTSKPTGIIPHSKSLGRKEPGVVYGAPDSSESSEIFIHGPRKNSGSPFADDHGI